MARQAIEAGTLKMLGEFEYETERADHLVDANHRPLNSKASIFRDWLIAAI
ncbi:hypothetical protein G3N95_20270 [Paraburkholderia sp. Tr-20389]|uniref:hypothetical protein n=1 Tax=Paraburkholderia sp. Tr-20389 TaxID=2703903 RepID=UPI001980A00C|nr:hypothetical protein [Paraburkholderia sp. Tr-20389]MBN3755292.1 hypothetical protein [Paraburkholderia sp. Tr-20389]